MNNKNKFRVWSTSGQSYQFLDVEGQQSLGIFDKNMKPVYEGDVVKGIYGLEGIEIIGEVSYNIDKCAYFVDWDYEISNIELGSLEIIGNMNEDFIYDEQGNLTRKQAVHNE